MILTLRIDVYALGDLTGHCYVHFAFVFTLTVSTTDGGTRVHYCTYRDAVIRNVQPVVAVFHADAMRHRKSRPTNHRPYIILSKWSSVGQPDRSATSLAVADHSITSHEAITIREAVGRAIIGVERTLIYWPISNLQEKYKLIKIQVKHIGNSQVERNWLKNIIRRVR